jgi:hypothetical protein
VIRIAMKVGKFPQEIGLSEFLRYLPDGDCFTKWTTEGLLDETNNRRLLYSLSGRPTMLLSTKISLKNVLKNVHKLDDIYFDMFGSGKIANNGGIPSDYYSVAFAKSDSDSLGSFRLCMPDGAIVGSPHSNLSNSFFELAVELSGRFAPEQLTVECSDRGVEHPTHSWPPDLKQPWVPGYCWVLLLPPAVLEVLGGTTRVLVEAPVQTAMEIPYGETKTAVICRVASTPNDADEKVWNAWRDFLGPVLGQPNSFPRTGFRWINQADLP